MCTTRDSCRATRPARRINSVAAGICIFLLVLIIIIVVVTVCLWRKGKLPICLQWFNKRRQNQDRETAGDDPTTPAGETNLAFDSESYYEELKRLNSARPVSTSNGPSQGPTDGGPLRVDQEVTTNLGHRQDTPDLPTRDTDPQIPPLRRGPPPLPKANPVAPVLPASSPTATMTNSDQQKLPPQETTPTRNVTAALGTGAALDSQTWPKQIDDKHHAEAPRYVKTGSVLPRTQSKDTTLRQRPVPSPRLSKDQTLSRVLKDPPDSTESDEKSLYVNKEAYKVKPAESHPSLSLHLPEKEDTQPSTNAKLLPFSFIKATPPEVDTLPTRDTDSSLPSHMGETGLNHQGPGQTGLNHPGPGESGLGYAGSDLSGLGHRGPGQSGLSHPGQSGLNHPGQSGLSHPGQSGLSHPGQSGLSHPGQSGLGQPGPGQSGLNHPGPGQMGLSYTGSDLSGPTSPRTDPEGEETDSDRPYFQCPPDSGLGQGSSGNSETFIKEPHGPGNDAKDNGH